MNGIAGSSSRDHIQKPKANGYHSYHMIVEVPVFCAAGSIRE